MGLITGAKTLKTEKPKAKGKTREEVQIDELDTYAKLDALTKALEAVKDSLKPVVQNQMVEHFVERGTTTGMKPESFRGVDGNASASCEIRKRSTRSTLKPAEKEMLDEAGISYSEEVVKEKAFLINPKYSEDMELLGKMEEALEGVDGLPEDLFQQQEKVYTTVVTDKSVNDLFATKNEETIRKLLDVVTTMAIKPTASSNDVKEFVESEEFQDLLSEL